MEPVSLERALKWARTDPACRKAGGFYVVEYIDGHCDYAPFGTLAPSYVDYPITHIRAWGYLRRTSPANPLRWRIVLTSELRYLSIDEAESDT